MATKTTVKKILIVMNVLVFLAGAVVFVSGLVIRVQSGLLDPDVITLFNMIEYNNVKMGTAVDVTDYIMMIAGAILLVVAVLGLCAAWKKIKCCLLMYVVIALLMVLVQAAAVGVWFSVRGRTDEWLRGRMLDLLMNYDGPTATDDTSVGWNALFVEAQCCSVNAYTDAATNDFSTLPATWWATKGADFIPYKCCQGENSDPTNTFTKACSETPTNYYTDGCYDVVRDYINTYAIVLAAAAAVLLVVEVVAIICSCVLIDKLKNRVEQTGGLGMTNGGPAQNIAYVDNVGKTHYKRF